MKIINRYQIFTMYILMVCKMKLNCYTSWLTDIYSWFSYLINIFPMAISGSGMKIRRKGSKITTSRTYVTVQYLLKYNLSPNWNKIWNVITKTSVTASGYFIELYIHLKHERCLQKWYLFDIFLPFRLLLSQHNKSSNTYHRPTIQ